MRHFYGLDSGDSTGNRRSHKEIQIPHDGVGNTLDPATHPEYISDQIGNSVDVAPTHQLNSASRKKSDQAPHQRVGRYILGGVNPLVAGFAHLAQEAAHPKPAPITQATADKNAQAQADKRLRRLFEFDEDDRIEYTLTSTPEEKRLQTQSVLKKIFELANCPAEITVSLQETDSKSQVVALVQHAAFKTGELSVAALNFLTNKIVNRLPSDRIRLSVKGPEAQETAPNSGE